MTKFSIKLVSHPEVGEHERDVDGEVSKKVRRKKNGCFLFTKTSRLIVGAS